VRSGGARHHRLALGTAVDWTVRQPASDCALRQRAAGGVLRSICRITKEPPVPQYQTTQDSVFTTPFSAEERISAFLRSVYGWMCAGLAITAMVAFFVASSPAMVETLVRTPFVMIGLVVAQLGLVFTLSLRVQKMASSTATALFVAYSALTGVTMSFVLLSYTSESVASTFAISAGMFGAMAVFGTVTKRSLAGWGQFLFMGLIGVVIASFVGMFWQNDAFQFVLGFIGVIVFTGLTAYDAQRLKAMALSLPSGGTGAYAVVGALTLYLDFVNLFLMLLRLTGDRRR
jgi:FtsH-binding integral membrane protein